MWNKTKKGGWALASIPILTTIITLKRLAKRGSESMFEH